jgi:mannose/fructose-specific phosphotransferase system component IIA
MKAMRIILAGHGDFSKGLKHSLGMIVGEEIAGRVETFSLLPGESAADYARSVEKRAMESGAQTAIATDVLGGSVCNELLRLASHPNVRVFSGANLAMALELVMTDEEGLTQERIDEIMSAAKNGINCFHSENLPPSGCGEF